MVRTTRRSAPKAWVRLSLLTVIGIGLIGLLTMGGSHLAQFGHLAMVGQAAQAMEIAVAQAPAASDTTTRPSANRDAAVVETTQTLRLGSRGEAVKDVQAKLQQLGYFAGDVDGIYGNATRQAILDFQTEIGVQADGIAGSETIVQLQTASPRAATTADAPSPSSASNPTDTTDTTKGAIAPSSTASSPTPAAPAASAADPALMPPDMQRILDRGKLIVAVLNEDNPPFFMAGDDDTLDGSDIQLARNIAQQLGVEVEFQRSAQTFNEVADTIYQRDADMAISKLSRTMQRAQRVRFSRPYLNMRHGLLVNRLQMAQQAKGRSMTEVIRNLEGRVGVIEGSSYVGFTKQKFPKAEVVEYPSWPDVVAAVTNGDVLMAYRDELEVKKIVRSQPNAALDFQTIALTDTNDFIAIAVPWENTHLLAFVDQYLETSGTTYTADSLLEQYSAYFQAKTTEES